MHSKLLVFDLSENGTQGNLVLIQRVYLLRAFRKVSSCLSMWAVLLTIKILVSVFCYCPQYFRRLHKKFDLYHLCFKPRYRNNFGKRNCILILLTCSSSCIQGKEFVSNLNWDILLNNFFKTACFSLQLSI